jgi:hypothetical protein
MTLDQLIDALSALSADGHGDKPVVTRGSKPTTFVDVENIRATKTASRRVVYIGKPKAVTAD